MLRCFTVIAVVVVLVAAPTLTGAQLSDPRDALDYAGVVLEPGDVISFTGGGATTGGLLSHGHASVYLGFDQQMGQRVFLDFSVTKGGVPEIIFGSPSGFNGRIMSEREFLTYNARWHASFDVYRLADRSTLDKRKLFREAKIIAHREWF